MKIIEKLRRRKILILYLISWLLGDMFYVVHCFSGELFVFFTQCLSCLVGGFTTLLDALVLTGSLLCNFFFTSYTIEKFDFSGHLILLRSLTFPNILYYWEVWLFQQQTISDVPVLFLCQSFQDLPVI